MVSTVKFIFSKAFFAEYLCMSLSRVSFVVLRYMDEECLVERPAIKVTGIDKWCFDIESGIFLHQSANHTPIPAEIKKCGDKIIFSINDSEIEYDLTHFRKHYSRYVVNSLIEDTHSAYIVPTIRKNKWKSRCQCLKLRFNKQFWSKLLHVNQQDISYGLIKAKYYNADEPDILRYTDLVPILKIKSTADYYFCIERGCIFKLENFNDEFNHDRWSGILLTEYVPARITFSKDEAVFHTESGERSVLHKANIYRHYMTRVTNDLIFLQNRMIKRRQQ